MAGQRYNSTFDLSLTDHRESATAKRETSQLSQTRAQFAEALVNSVESGQDVVVAIPEERQEKPAGFVHSVRLHAVAAAKILGYAIKVRKDRGENVVRIQVTGSATEPQEAEAEAPEGEMELEGAI